MLNWEKIAVHFINKTSHWDNESNDGDLLSFSVSLLRELTGAYTSLEIAFEDKVTAKVKNATPSFMDELVLNPVAVHQLLAAQSYQSFCWSEIPQQNNVLQDLLMALSSAAIIPIQYHQHTSIILLGWSEPQAFGAFFSETARLIKARLENSMLQYSRQTVLLKSNAYLSGILEAMPQAVVFIDDNGHTGWLNHQAARLLQLPVSGELPPHELAGAMAQWRNKAVNAVEIHQQAAAFFAKPGSNIRDWLWQFEEAESTTYNVSCTSVHTGLFTGKLWVFDNVSALTN